mmetsp:Transcript_34101/g.80902  ORF Transcript_34101/g.80902 Transcript_34101/m.80902 type:complete len:252 (-) Transcript_34101:66-821(-)
MGGARSRVGQDGRRGAAWRGAGRGPGGGLQRRRPGEHARPPRQRPRVPWGVPWAPAEPLAAVALRQPPRCGPRRVCRRLGGCRPAPRAAGAFAGQELDRCAAAVRRNLQGAAEPPLGREPPAEPPGGGRGTARTAGARRLGERARGAARRARGPGGARGPPRRQQPALGAAAGAVAAAASRAPERPRQPPAGRPPRRPPRVRPPPQHRPPREPGHGAAAPRDGRLGAVRRPPPRRVRQGDRVGGHARHRRL